MKKVVIVFLFFVIGLTSFSQVNMDVELIYYNKYKPITHLLLSSDDEIPKIICITEGLDRECIKKDTVYVDKYVYDNAIELISSISVSSFTNQVADISEMAIRSNGTDYFLLLSTEYGEVAMNFQNISDDTKNRGIIPYKKLWYDLLKAAHLKPRNFGVSFNKTELKLLLS